MFYGRVQFCNRFCAAVCSGDVESLVTILEFILLKQSHKSSK